MDEEQCGYNCGRAWNAQGDENGFDDCVSAYHQKVVEENNYKLSLDDHCLLVKIGKNKMWLNRQVCEWILNNCDRIEFEEGKLLVDEDVSHIYIVSPKYK